MHKIVYLADKKGNILVNILLLKIFIANYCHLKMIYVGCYVLDFWDRLNAYEKGAYTNSVDPDETPQNSAFHQGLCCLPR